jgi:hypothetical protein
MEMSTKSIVFSLAIVASCIACCVIGFFTGRSFGETSNQSSTYIFYPSEKLSDEEESALIDTMSKARIVTIEDGEQKPEGYYFQ